MKKLMVGVIAVALLFIAVPHVETQAEPESILRVPADYPTIQAAIDAAFDGNTVLVADGTYTGLGNKNLDFGGKAIIVKSENGPANCIIDCEGSGRGFNFHSGEANTAVVEGFTIRNGNVTDAGGAIRCEHASPTIRNCVMTENTGHYGGALSCISSSAHIYKCVMKNNSTSDLFLGYGGAIYGLVFDGILSECVIVNNKAAWGGAMRCAWSEALITQCKIESNAATFGGGGIFTNGWETMRITNCLVSRNSAKYGAGIYAYYYSPPSIINCTIADNSASESGGGISSVTASPTVSNTIIWGNTAPTGNEIYTSSPESTVTLNYCDYADNTIDPNNIAGPGTVTPNNCISEDPLFVGGDPFDYHLQEGSPCIDAGSDALVPEGIITDLDGKARIVDGDLDGVETVDIGAYEYSVPVSFESTIDAVDNFYLEGQITTWGTANSLIQHLQTAQIKEEEEKFHIAINQVEAFQNVLEAQRGISIAEGAFQPLYCCGDELLAPLQVKETLKQQIDRLKKEAEEIKKIPDQIKDAEKEYNKLESEAKSIHEKLQTEIEPKKIEKLKEDLKKCVGGMTSGMTKIQFQILKWRAKLRIIAEIQYKREKEKDDLDDDQEKELKQILESAKEIRLKVDKLQGRITERVIKERTYLKIIEEKPEEDIPEYGKAVVCVGKLPTDKGYGLYFYLTFKPKEPQAGDRHRYVFVQLIQESLSIDGQMIGPLRKWRVDTVETQEKKGIDPTYLPYAYDGKECFGLEDWPGFKNSAAQYEKMLEGVCKVFGKLKNKTVGFHTELKTWLIRIDPSPSVVVGYWKWGFKVEIKTDNSGKIKKVGGKPDIKTVPFDVQFEPHDLEDADYKKKWKMYKEVVKGFLNNDEVLVPKYVPEKK